MLRISGNATSARSARSRATPVRDRSAASNESRASMPSAGVIVSRTLPTKAWATPTSDHGPQLITAAGRPDALRHATRASSHALAHAYAPCPGEPNSEATEENPSHQSSSQLALAWCIRSAPAALGAQTRSRLSLLIENTRLSSITAAPCTMPRNSRCCPRPPRRGFRPRPAMPHRREQPRFRRGLPIRPGPCAVRQWDRCGR